MAETSRILLLEDSPTQAEELRQWLELQGWSVDWAATAEAAFQQLGASLPDLVVADCNLPGMSGDEFCRRLRMNVDTRAIPVLMLTVEDTHTAELRGLDAGADDYLAKSTDRDILVLRIRALLRKSQVQESILGRAEAFFRRARLLAIDDSLTYLAYLAEQLSGEGYAIEQAASGAAGLERIRREPFDCVLVDLAMPDMDGIEVCVRIAELRHRMDSPILVLMLTAHESKEDMTRGLEAGADDFVGKSSDMAVLKARIRALLRRKFFQEENRRILEELKNKELEAVRARAEKEAAQAKAALAEKLAATNRQLEDTNRALKAAQAHLIQSEKMASLGQLVAGIAHELNNPLAFVLNHLCTVEESLQRHDLEKAADRMAGMREGLERIRGLVNGLRTFSRLDQAEFSTIDVHQSIESVLLFLRHRMEGRIAVEKRYAGHGALSCYAGQLNQVLMNLVSNAIDAIEGEGRITISTCSGGGSMRIAIRDTGSGVPDAVRDRIFEPFFTTKPPGGGVGLGLAIAYSIVQNHHGSIEVESRPGEGSEFTLRIPLDLKGGERTC